MIQSSSALYLLYVVYTHITLHYKIAIYMPAPSFTYLFKKYLQSIYYVLDNMGETVTGWTAIRQNPWSQGICSLVRRHTSMYSNTYP